MFSDGRRRLTQQRKREKEEEARAREELRRKLEEDRKERRRKLGLPEELTEEEKVRARGRAGLRVCASSLVLCIATWLTRDACAASQAREAEKRKKQEEEEASKKAFNYVKPISCEYAPRALSGAPNKGAQGRGTCRSPAQPGTGRFSSRLLLGAQERQPVLHSSLSAVCLPLQLQCSDPVARRLPSRPCHSCVPPRSVVQDALSVGDPEEGAHGGCGRQQRRGGLQDSVRYHAQVSGRPAGVVPVAVCMTSVSVLCARRQAWCGYMRAVQWETATDCADWDCGRVAAVLVCPAAVGDGWAAGPQRS